MALYLLLSIIGFLVGLLIISFGGGGGAIYVGILTGFFGIAPGIAAFTSLAAMIPATAVGAGRYIPMTIKENAIMLESSPQSHVYLKRLEENTLIDTSMLGASGKILRELKEIEVPNISHILLTHHDVDHIGSARRISERTGAASWAADEDIPYIKGERRRPGIKRVIPSVVRPGIPNVRSFSRPNNPFNGLQIIKAPCHTPGHVIFLYENVLFTGDLFKIVNGEFRLSRNG